MRCVILLRSLFPNMRAISFSHVTEGGWTKNSDETRIRRTICLIHCQISLFIQKYRNSSIAHFQFEFKIRQILPREREKRLRSHPSNHHHHHHHSSSASCRAQMSLSNIIFQKATEPFITSQGRAGTRVCMQFSRRPASQQTTPSRSRDWWLEGWQFVFLLIRPWTQHI